MANELCVFLSVRRGTHSGDSISCDVTRIICRSGGGVNNDAWKISHRPTHAIQHLSESCMSTQE